ncbi:unnamed protein product [Protopolystoma xenopodis]|uniref:Uncharacterized protein n=1 Tax=Protopolystoma xenopodis TaxID=117903 RepID=A0A448XFP8_9PLAT|nr:unnamed protein product [Protopolystoma xenopodis]
MFWLSGGTSLDFLIKSSFLQSSLLEERFRVCLLVASPTTIWGEVCTQFRALALPVTGSCVVNGTSPLKVDSTICITCTGFTSIYGQITYNLFSKNSI